MRSNTPLIGLAAAATLAGCSGLLPSRFDDPSLPRDIAAQKRQEHDARFYDPGNPHADASGYVDASAYAAEVDAALERSAQPGSPAQPHAHAQAPNAPANPDRQIVWLDTEANPADVDPPETDQPTEPVISPFVDAADEANQAAGLPDLAADPVAAPASSGRDRAWAQLVAALQQEDAPALHRALAAAAVSAADPQRRLDEAFLADLGPRQRQAVERYHRMVLDVYDQIANGSERLDGRTLAEHIDAVVGPLPIQISTIELCKRVRGFGVYDAFDASRFLAGRDHKMIVYVEVDHFVPVETSTGEFEVKLTQEVELYDKDGLMVWRHDPVNIVDRSRNQRRDFFTVQMIALPARLTVGTFHLKVRLADEHGQTRTERTLDLDIVADQSLVSGK